MCHKWVFYPKSHGRFKMLNRPTYDVIYTTPMSSIPTRSPLWFSLSIQRKFTKRISLIINPPKQYPPSDFVASTYFPLSACRFSLVAHEWRRRRWWMGATTPAWCEVPGRNGSAPPDLERIAKFSSDGDEQKKKSSVGRRGSESVTCLPPPVAAFGC